MYCPSCSSNSLDRLEHGTKVLDFKCGKCDEGYQCKSLSKPIGHKILDSAYEAMITAIKTDNAPNLLILHYSKEEWIVQNLLIIPRHLLTVSAIEERKPLSPSARRAGWIGCNIILDRMPTSGRIFAVKDSMLLKPSEVRAEWRQLAFLRDLAPESRGWLVDVLSCIQSLDKHQFTLAEAYKFERELCALHPENRHIKPKIRQQLQILRDRGILKFAARGQYEFVAAKLDSA